jgi:hypothetical protein
MRKHKELIQEMLEQPTVKAEYDARAEEFALLDESLRARQEAGLVQTDQVNEEE